MRHIAAHFALSALLCLSGASCALFTRPVAVPVVAVAPVIHVQPAPVLPEYNFQPSSDLRVYLSFQDYLNHEEAQAKLYARLQYFKTLLLQYGAIFDSPALPPAAVPTP